jgi:hypothetical protein
MNYRAVSGIATPKNCAASPAFLICYLWRRRGKPRFPHLLFMEKAGQAPLSSFAIYGESGASPRPAFLLPSKENPMATRYARADYGVFIIPRKG